MTTTNPTPEAVISSPEIVVTGITDQMVLNALEAFVIKYIEQRLQEKRHGHEGEGRRADHRKDLPVLSQSGRNTEPVQAVLSGSPAPRKRGRGKLVQSD